jgi:hypothetical protein
MRLLAAITFASLLAQDPAIDLETERLALVTGSPHALITLIAEYADGTPVRGVIQCAGTWRKYQDGVEFYTEALPFATDSRGAVIMNPHVEDEAIVCWSQQDGVIGRTTVTFDANAPAKVQRIVLRKDS